MRKIGGFFKRVVAHPKSSAAGVGMIALGIFSIAGNPAMVSDPETLGTIIAGVGLLATADAKDKRKRRKGVSADEETTLGV